MMPYRIKKVSGWSFKEENGCVAAGNSSFLTTKTNEIHSFGCNKHGQCGVRANLPTIYSPMKVNVPGEIQHLAVGVKHC